MPSVPRAGKIATRDFLAETVVQQRRWRGRNRRRGRRRGRRRRNVLGRSTEFNSGYFQWWVLDGLCIKKLFCLCKPFSFFLFHIIYQSLIFSTTRNRLLRALLLSVNSSLLGVIPLLIILNVG